MVKTFEGFLERLELIIIEGITIIKMTKQGTGDDRRSHILSYDRKISSTVSKQ